jgi:transcription antitermination factor NusG
MSYRIARLMTRAAKARTIRPHLWKKKQWRFIDETSPLQPAPQAGVWHVLLVEPRMEKKAAEALREAGYTAWYPQTVEMRTNQQRMLRRKFNEPLFQRYVFVTGQGYRLGMVDCKHVSMVVGKISQKDINDLSGRQAGGEFVAKVAGHGFAKGEHVKVKEGPFGGLDGIVEKTTRDRVSILMNILGRSTEISVDASVIEMAA